MRPFGFIMKRNEKLYFCTNKKKEVYRDLKENPQIEVCALSKDTKKWIRIRGEVIFDESEEAKAQVF
ncbi:MAG: pyridoxamine 5'-phosphate oxidase family protein [Deltaproteobacteria bacterium]|nr:pyridoxamine 5'-phosphate oxidase family protein [Deltaproteobacteria bacterium]